MVGEPGERAGEHRRGVAIAWSVALGWGVALVAGCGEPRSGDEDVSLPTSAGSTGASAGTEDEPEDPRLDLGGGTGASDSADPDAPTVCEDNLDIVFVMDVSTSMDVFLDALAAEIAAVDQAVAALGLPSAPHYGLVVFVDDVALLGAGAPYPDVATLQADFSQWSDFTATNQQTSGGNSNGTWPENSLDALWVASTGFQWRPAASTARLVIHTTDDTFWEGPGNFNGETVQHGYADTVDQLQAQSIRVFSFAAQIGGSCSCEDVTPGWSTPYLGQPSIPEATDGAVFDLDQIISGSVSLADAIGSAVEASRCTPYEPVG